MDRDTQQLLGIVLHEQGVYLTEDGLVVLLIYQSSGKYAQHLHLVVVEGKERHHLGTLLAGEEFVLYAGANQLHLVVFEHFPLHLLVEIAECSVGHGVGISGLYGHHRYRLLHHGDRGDLRFAVGGVEGIHVDQSPVFKTHDDGGIVAVQRAEQLAVFPFLQSVVYAAEVGPAQQFRHFFLGHALSYCVQSIGFGVEHAGT